MNVPGVAWVGLILILIPVIQSFVAMQWPEQSYPITFLIVGVLGGVAKWLQMYFQPSQPAQPPAPSGAMSAAAPQPEKQPARLRTWLIG